jgi:hypothetical protein
VLAGLSGISDVLEQIQREPQNAFAHYRNVDGSALASPSGDVTVSDADALPLLVARKAFGI